MNKVYNLTLECMYLNNTSVLQENQLWINNNHFSLDSEKFWTGSKKTSKKYVFTPTYELDLFHNNDLYLKIKKILLNESKYNYLIKMIKKLKLKQNFAISIGAVSAGIKI